MAKFYDIDPETCSLGELKEAIRTCEQKQEYYDALQIGAKLFINSVYGVFGTNFFNLCNKELAESITLQGQDLIKFSVINLNDYFKNGWKDDETTHKKISEYMKKIFPDFDSENFERLAKSNTLSFDTLQVYGDTDSVSKDSVIKTKKHPDGITIEDFYNENSDNKGESTLAGHESVKTTDQVLNYTDGIKLTDVERIIRHKVNKPKYVLKTKSGKKVECTGDHSLVIFRNGKKMVVKPTDIKNGDKVISMETKQ